MRRRRAVLAALASVVLALGGCASGTAPAGHGSSAAPSTTPTLPRCPDTTPPLQPQVAGQPLSIPTDPVGAIACVVNKPASKAVGVGTRVPADVATVLARLLDQAVPAPAAAAGHCAAHDPLVLVRFAYRSQTVDVADFADCAAVVYVAGRAYSLASLLGGYLRGLTTPPGGGFAPDVEGMPLAEASVIAAQAGDSLQLSGELVDRSTAGTILLQSPTVARQVDAIVAVRRSPACAAGQLAVQYLPGTAGTGNDFGTLVLRGVSGAWCEIDGPVTVTGLTNGRAVTRSITSTPVGRVELSPHAKPAVVGSAPRADQLTASISLVAGYRDDSDGLSCAVHWVVPETWRVAVGGQVLTVANGRGTADARPIGSGGLVTCRGRFGAGPVAVS